MSDAETLRLPQTPALTRPAPGALRAVSRLVGGTLQLAVTGPSAVALADGDKLLGIWWMASETEARRVEAAAAALLAAAHFALDQDGFSAFPAGKVGNLVSQAMLHAGVTALRAENVVQDRTPPRPWSQWRIARLAFLIGQGYEAKDIARDPDIDTSPSNVHRQASRLGLSFRDVPRGRMMVVVTREDIAQFERLAADLNVTSQMMLRRFVKAAPVLAPLVFPVPASDSVSL